VKLHSSRIIWIALALAAAMLSVPSAHAQQVPGRVRVQIARDMTARVEALFANVRPANDTTYRRTSVASAIVSDAKALERALAIPTWVRSARLSPFIPTHSVALPDVRRRTNPELFTPMYSVGGTSRDQNLALAEEKVARWFTLRFDPTIPVEQVLAALGHSKVFERIEPVTERKTCYVPNDSLVPSQYSLPLMHTFEAWDVVRCDTSMIVADVDLGTDWTHPDLARAIYVNPGEIGLDSDGIDKRANGVDDDGNGLIDDWHGWDFDGPDGATPDNDPRTPQSHGTHTAGILAATGDNRSGIAGIAFGARLIPIKASDESGISIDFGFDGIAYAADMHAKVVSCSWGGPTRSQAEQDVINYAYAKDCAVVAAAGNQGIYAPFYPATYDHVLSVGAVQDGGGVAGYSNYNPWVDVVAPGTEVLSTMPGGWYFTQTGTSMACPNAAGGLALVRARFPSLSVAQAMERLRAASTQMDTNASATLPVDAAHFDFLGHGLVNIAKAVSNEGTISTRIESWKFRDPDHNELLEPGETSGIELTLRNYLSPVRDLIARFEVVSGREAITLLDSVVTFGAAGTMDSLRNDPTRLRVRAADSIEHNTEVLIKVVLRDPGSSYDRDVDYLHFELNPDYLDLNANNLTVTISSKGTIGYNDVIVNDQGTGFQWRVPPPTISPRGRNVLYQSGLLLATDQNHIVDAVEGVSQYVPDNDFVPITHVHYVEPDAKKALQELVSTFDDSAAGAIAPTDSTRRIGVIVQNSSYAFGGSASNAVILSYAIRQPPEITTTTLLHAGIFADWDIGISGSINATYFDSATSTAVTHRLEAGYPWVGVKLIGARPPGVTLNFHAIRNDGTEGDINTYDGFDQYEKWIALTEPYPATGPGDVSQMISLSGLELAPGVIDTITAVMALGESEEALRANVAAAEADWLGRASVRSVIQSTDILAYPTPFQHSLTVVVPLDASAPHLTILDVLGRTVYATDIVSGMNTLSLDLPPGAYVVKVHSGDREWSRVVTCAGK
jgi:hypothetical protein